MSITFDVLTFRTFRNLTARVRRSRHEDFLLLSKCMRSLCPLFTPALSYNVDARILVFSLLQFMVLAILASIYGAMTFAALSGNFKLVSRLYAFAKYVVDILCFTGPVFLLSTR